MLLEHEGGSEAAAMLLFLWWALSDEPVVAFYFHEENSKRFRLVESDQALKTHSRRLPFACGRSCWLPPCLRRSGSSAVDCSSSSL